MEQKPALDDLSEEAAEAIKVWLSYVEQDSGPKSLWVHSDPRGGSSHAAFAAMWELGKLPAYKNGGCLVMDAYGAYQDLHSLWDSNRHKDDAPSFAEWSSLDAEIDANWKRSVILLNDWMDTVPIDFFAKHFYPRLRVRAQAGLPTIIATRYSPEALGAEAQFFYDLFVVVEVNRSHAGR